MIPDDSNAKNRTVFVIHGRDERLRRGVFDFLRSLDLRPLEWSQAIELTSKASPYIGEVLDAAFDYAQAVVVVFSPDDLACLRPELRGEREPAHEIALTPQARANVLFESGMAMARDPRRTILLEIGEVRPFSDIGGRHTIRMDSSLGKRNDFAQRLRTAGCPVNLNGSDWHVAGDMTAPRLQATPTVIPSAAEGQADSNGETLLLADLISELEDNLEKARGPRMGETYRRPSVEMWKRNRNKLSLPQSFRGELEEVYRHIDGWASVVDSGISPNYGCPALNNATSWLAVRLPEVIRLLKELLANGQTAS